MTLWLARRLHLAPEGISFVLPLALGTLLCGLAGWRLVTVLGVLVSAGVACFFRDPERTVPVIPAAVVSPADGRVMAIVDESADTQRISIFLSITDVHINRAPYGGKVSDVLYTPGAFLAAYRPEASLRNEANSLTIEHQGTVFVVKQIAGLIARRIVCRVQPGDVLAKGQRYGLIRFGSRTDLFLPNTAEICVQVGEVVRGGETILAFLKEPQGV